MAEPFVWTRIDEGMSPAELIRVLNTRLPRIARELATMTTDLSPVTSILGRFQEYRVSLMDTTGTALNDGDPLPVSLDAYTRFSPVSTAPGGAFVRTTGGRQATYRQVDSRRCFSPETLAAAVQSSYRFSPHGLAVDGSQFVDFRPTFGAVTSDASAAPPLFSTSIMAWLRKRVAGEATSSRVTFGFADNTIVYPSGPVARCGLIGDGVTGYRFGSVNCPDGLIGGQNAVTDIDANSVSPAELVSPGTNWFHVRIKMVPPTTAVAGKWGAYLNGLLVATFTSTVNFPRGSQTTSHDYNRIEPSYLNFGDTVATTNGLLAHDIRLWVEEDLTLV